MLSYKEFKLLKEIYTITISICPLCNMSHENMVFKKMIEPIFIDLKLQMTHSSECFNKPGQYLLCCGELIENKFEKGILND